MVASAGAYTWRRRPRHFLRRRAVRAIHASVTLAIALLLPPLCGAQGVVLDNPSVSGRPPAAHAGAGVQLQLPVESVPNTVASLVVPANAASPAPLVSQSPAQDAPTPLLAGQPSQWPRRPGPPRRQVLRPESAARAESRPRSSPRPPPPPPAAWCG